MDKLRITFIFVISVILLHTSCTKDDGDELNPAANELVGTWKMIRGYEYLIENGTKVPDSRSAYDRDDLYYFVFHLNGDITTHDVRGSQVDKATYIFDRVGRLVNVVEGGVKLQFSIAELSATTLNFTVFIKDEDDETLHDLYFTRSADLPRGR